ncbi:MAG: F0F1 ATP synthase subunit delta [bacterium]
MANDKYKTLAKDVYLDLKRFKKAGFEDSGLILFSIIKNIQGSDIDKVFEEYKKIITKENLIIEVLSATKLDDNQVSKLESNVTKKITNAGLIFHYSIDAKVKGGIVIRNNDDLIDMSMATDIANLKINS